MGTIFDERERRRLIGRLRTIAPSAPPRWGTMSAHRMVCHLKDAVESGLHDSSEAIGKGVLARFPVKHLVIYLLPWPKGKLQSPASLFTTSPTEWSRDVAELESALARAAAKGPNAKWPASDVFGKLSGKEWGALLRTHVNHHLKQFGA